MTTMIPMPMPSIALPTGPYDWRPERTPRSVYDARLAALRAIMSTRGATHGVVHGNGFDHAAIAWLTHFTPKLGPAYALVPSSGPVRLLFAGGPGMKPSAQRLTWVEDVAALKGVEGDVERWLDEAGSGASAKLGLVEGRAMLRGDWHAVQRAAGGAAIELDDAVDLPRSEKSKADIAAAAQAEHALRIAADNLAAHAGLGADLRAAVIEAERAAYAAGAQDVRVRIARAPCGLPTTLPDTSLPMRGPTAVVLAVRHSGAWAAERLVLG